MCGLQHHEYQLVYSPSEQMTGLGHGGKRPTLHTVVQTRTEEGENISAEPGPPGLPPRPHPPLYLLKLSWLGRGPTGPSFTPPFPLTHTLKQHATPEVSGGGPLNTSILKSQHMRTNAQEGGDDSSLLTLIRLDQQSFPSDGQQAEKTFGFSHCCTRTSCFRLHHFGETGSLTHGGAKKNKTKKKTPGLIACSVFFGSWNSELGMTFTFQLQVGNVRWTPPLLL